MKAYSQTDEAKSLTGAKKRLLEETILDFTENGADLPPEEKSRLEEVQAVLATLTQKFSENVLDSMNAWELIIEDESRLAGLPPNIKSGVAQRSPRKRSRDRKTGLACHLETACVFSCFRTRG